MGPENGGSERRNGRPSVNSPMVFGTSLVLGAGVLILAGYWMDQRAGGGYIRTIIGLCLAMLYVAYEVWKLASSLKAGPGANDSGIEPPPDKGP